MRSTDFMKSTSYKGSIPGLSRLEALLAVLGNPENSLRFVHVTGTNGKGSVCEMLRNILTESGLKTGCFTSPSLTDIYEQITVDGRRINEHEYESMACEIQDACANLTDIPTEFELLTAAAILYFKKIECDIVVFEAGLGGALDATNIIPPPVCAIITGIGLEHMQYLGNSMVSIAEHKAGIIKKGTRAVCFGPDSEEVKAVIQRRADEVGANLRFTGTEGPDIRERSTEGTVLDYTTGKGTAYKTLFLPLIGHYQQKNIQTVLEAVDAINEAAQENEMLFRRKNPGGKLIEINTVMKALAKVKWPARFEITGHNPLIILDGGHNPDCIQELTKTFDDLFPNQKFIIVTGVMADKDYENMYAMLNPYAEVYICVSPGNSRALSTEKLAAHLSKYGKPVEIAESPKDGIALAKKKYENMGKKICVTGSLYMMGEIRSELDLH